MCRCLGSLCESDRPALFRPGSHGIAKGVTDAPLIQNSPPQGRPADRLAAILAAVALLGSLGATLWFFAGFVETDPEFRAASSAFLLSMGLGAFAIIPSAVVMRLGWSAWRRGFRLRHGIWTLVLMGPWIGLSSVLVTQAPLPKIGPFIALGLSTVLCLWALISLIIEAKIARDTLPPRKRD